MQQLGHCGDLTGKDRAGDGRGEHRQGRVLEKDPQPGGVIGMGMGDKNSGEGVRGMAQGLQSRFHAPGGDAGVHQNAHAAAADQGGVSLRAAGQGMDGDQMSDLACEFVGV